MSSLNFEPRSTTGLAAQAALSDGTLTVGLQGTADQRETEFLDGVMTDAHAEALRLNVDELAVDFRELEFMNSTAFKALLTWITTLVGLPEDEQYKVRFLSTPRHHWQRRSLDALRCFAVHLITVES